MSYQRSVPLRAIFATKVTFVIFHMAVLRQVYDLRHHVVAVWSETMESYRKRRLSLLEHAR